MYRKVEGDASKREMIILSSCRPIVKQQVVYTYVKEISQCSIALFARFTFLRLLLFQQRRFLLTPTVFLPLFAGEFHKGR